MDDRVLLTSAMQKRLTMLKVYLDSESLASSTREAALERQARLILKELDKELIQSRQPVLDYLTLLGFGYLIEEQP